MPRRPAGLGKGLALAIVAHLLLVAALTFSVNWRVSTPEGVEAELWSAVPQIAAPRASPPPPPPPPEAPARSAKPQPAPPPPKAEPQPDAQIAIEKAKRLEDKRKQELAEQAKEAREAKLKKAEQEKALKEKAAQDKAEQAKKLAEQKRKDEAADKLKTEQTAKKRDAAAQAAADKAREDQMQRIAAMAGATGAPTATGNAQQNAGPSADYIGRIKGRIRPNVSFPDNLPGNPAVEVEITVAPDGRIVSSRIVEAQRLPRVGRRGEARHRQDRGAAPRRKRAGRLADDHRLQAARLSSTFRRSEIRPAGAGR